MLTAYLPGMRPGGDRRGELPPRLRRGRQGQPVGEHAQGCAASRLDLFAPAEAQPCRPRAAAIEDGAAEPELLRQDECDGGAA